MSTGTRAARAATSRQAKQEIVRLLFGTKYSKTGPEKHKLLDYSIYSYTDLKKAYLEKLQEIHPDKFKQQQQQQHINNNSTTTTTTTTHYFHELQTAWKKYDDIAKAMKSFKNNSNSNRNTKPLMETICSRLDLHKMKRMKMRGRKLLFYKSNSINKITRDDTLI